MGFLDSVWDWWLRRVTLGQGRNPDGTRAAKRTESRAGTVNTALITVSFTTLYLALLSASRLALPSADAYLPMSLCIVGVLGALGYWFAAVSSRESKARYPLDEEKDIRLKTERLSAALAEAAQLSVDLTDLMRERRTVLDGLRVDVERWERQAKISKEDAATITEALDRSLDRSVRHLDRVSFFWGVFAAVVAVGLAYLPELLKHLG